MNPVFAALQVTWGLPQTLVGGTMALALRSRPHTAFRNARVITWRMGAGLSLGPFVFVPEYASRSLLVHEYGHTIQSLILGPLYVPLVVLPSLVWAGLPAFDAWRRARNVSYYAMPVERWANMLGERVCGEPAPR